MGKGRPQSNWNDADYNGMEWIIVKIVLQLLLLCFTTIDIVTSRSKLILCVGCRSANIASVWLRHSSRRLHNILYRIYSNAIYSIIKVNNCNIIDFKV